jgi:hypothetical protein
MTCHKITTQAELDAGYQAAPGDCFHVRAGTFVAWGSAHVVAWGSAHVEAWGSAHVEARGSAHVVAWESAHVVARESAHVEAWGSAHVVAWESAHVVARESAHVEASAYVAVHQHGTRTTVSGGGVIRVPVPTTALAWCEFYGVAVDGAGVATVYKGVRDDYRSAHGSDYRPGTMPMASDWDGGTAECGGGLHFSPHPLMTLAFDETVTRFLACPVALTDMRAPGEADNHPQKIKARGACGPLVEVDRAGCPLRAEPGPIPIP